MLSTVAVDLTPVLPGGENGGAKVLALALVRGLAARAPQTRFVLLTQAASHEELAALDADNVRRVRVVGPAATSVRSQGFRWAAPLLAPFPDPLRRAAARAGYRLQRSLQRSGSSRLLRDMGVDLLFCPFTAPTYREAGIPTVCTIYDLQYRAYPQFFSIEDAVQREGAFDDACKGATALAAISNFSRDAAIAEGHLDPGRIRTIYLRLAHEAPAAGGGVVSRLGLAPGRYLIYPANFWKHKNHEALLDAFARASATGLPPDVKLVCTGAPNPRQEMLARAAQSAGLEGRVLFPGFLPDEESNALMESCGGVIFPSLYEGFGLPVAEAMARGVPVACSNVTALPEIAGDAALLFDPRAPEDLARAMVALMEDKALRERLIAAGRRRAAQFTDTTRMIEEYWQLLESAHA